MIKEDDKDSCSLESLTILFNMTLEEMKGVNKEREVVLLIGRERGFEAVTLVTEALVRSAPWLSGLLPSLRQPMIKMIGIASLDNPFYEPSNHSKSCTPRRGAGVQKDT